MASFDPSVISQIPTLAGNPMQSVQQAYQLKDLANQEQLDTLKLNQAKQGVSDAAKAKKILSGYDLSDPTQLMKASEALNKAGQADRAMDLLKESQSQTKAKYEISEAHIKILQATSDFIGPNAIAIKQTLAKNPAMARAQYADLMGQILPQLPPELAASIPAQPPKDDAQFGQLLDKAISGSAQARQALTLHLGERKQDTAEASLAERERHDEAMETAQAKRAAEGGFTDQQGDLMAALAERGVSLPTGFRSKAQQATLYKGLLARNPGKSPDEIADGIAKGQIEFGAQKKETQTAAAVAGKVEVAQNEIEEFVPLVREAAAKVPRGQFVPLTKLMQMGQEQISNPELRSLKIRINSLLNAYDMLASRGGTDVEKRKEVRSLLTAADSPEAMDAALKSFELEASAAHKAAVAATKAPELPNTTAAKTLTYDPATGTIK